VPPGRQPLAEPRPPVEPADELEPAVSSGSGEPTEPIEPGVLGIAISEAIETGAVDPLFRELSATIRRRQRQLVRKTEVDAAARFAVGDRVRLGPAVRPKYLRGATATIAGWAHKNVLIRLDAPIGRYPAGTEVSVSPLGVRRIAA
jgi:hypothetical protein